ncbi:diguanylate cyclase [Methylococcus sp. EFPC2]|uniref:GGDEF domain-containing protein n=1 Tax=Methylococcus sp. EFPC2 TaxID=2812648 RepID=UPI001F07F6C4|nr:sensor domain-containing diguanylate cyclase [Methylococcus sp. EFPC2]
MDELNTELRVLQSHLDNLIDCVRQNDIKLHRFQTLEMTMLSLNSLRELIEQTLQDTRQVFELDHVSLALVDDKKELRKFLEEDGLPPDQLAELVLLESASALEKSFGRLMRPYLGPFRREHCGSLFKRLPTHPDASFALLPLYRRGRLLGSLNLASENPARFGVSMATDFLDRLSAVLSVCLENTLNFELLRRTSLIDPLTGVNNRRFFDQRIGEEINRVLRGGSCLACLFLDIDHFKRINDTFGHQTGDLVLGEVARGIRSLLRNNDVLARYGGEEFIALLEVSSEDKAMEVAERIRLHVERADLTSRDGRRIPVHLSIGVATMEPSQWAGDEKTYAAKLIDLADRALYLAKGRGRNRVVSAGLLRPEPRKTAAGTR